MGNPSPNPKESIIFDTSENNNNNQDFGSSVLMDQTGSNPLFNGIRDKKITSFIQDTTLTSIRASKNYIPH